jgi:hypothetical protein
LELYCEEPGSEELLRLSDFAQEPVDGLLVHLADLRDGEVTNEFPMGVT